MKVLTAAQMREIDRKTIELGIPGLILMENAALRVVEFLERRFAPLAEQRIVVYCGKGNNGGDGLAIARQLFVRVKPQSLSVLLAAEPESLSGDAAANWKMLQAAGCPAHFALTSEMRGATLVIDALLGTGLRGAATGAMQERIGELNSAFPQAKTVAVDLPSGIISDTGALEGDYVRADASVTFTAPKIAQAMPPACNHMGELVVSPIGSPARLYEDDHELFLSLVEPKLLKSLFAPRDLGANKGTYGHVLCIAGSRGRAGAAAMCSMAALRVGAGLVTAASATSVIGSIAQQMPELMTEPLSETSEGAISFGAWRGGALAKAMERKNVVAIGPGLGTGTETVQLVREVFAHADCPLVADADALNALAESDFHGGEKFRVLTPHPGEMSRLTGKKTAEVQSDRIALAREFAEKRKVCVVLKGERTIIAFADGRAFINPTGTPAMAKGGTGDVLTGLVAGMLAQFPKQADLAVLSAVWLHGRAGEHAAAHWGDKCVVATDLLKALPEAMRDLSHA